jgi:Predicted phosphohydrolases
MVEDMGNASNYYDRIEIFVSYIKILGRPHPTDYYHIRQAIYSILHIMLDYILDKKITGKNSKQIIKIIELIALKDDKELSIIKYQCFLTLLKRIADLESSWIFEAENIKKTIAFLRSLIDKQSEDSKKIELLEREKVVFEFAKTIKWSAMSTDEESKCFKIKEINEKLNIYDTALKDYIEPLKELLYYENTRVIYTGIKELLKQFDRKIDKNIGDKFLERYYLLNSSEGEIKIKSLLFEAVNENSEPLRQNPLYKILSFLAEMQESPKEITFLEIKKVPQNKNEILINDSLIKKLFLLCKYATITDEIEKSEYVNNAGKLIYLYYELIDIIRDLIGLGDEDTADTYLVYADENGEAKKIIRSSRNTLVGDKEADEDDLSKLINKFKDDTVCKSISESCAFFDDTICMQNCKIDDKEYKAILIKIGLNYPGFEKPLCKENEYSFLVTLIKADNKNLKKNIRNVICYRERLCRSLSRDIHILRSIRHDKDYVGKFKLKFDLSDAKNPPVNILHISDIHAICDNEMTGNIMKIAEKVKEKYELKEDNEIDLMVITGDVAQGRDTGEKLKKNYDEAYEIIKIIAEVIWKRKDKTIANDWKKRILIIPGNHDYAAMNEFQALLKGRQVISGIPQDEGLPDIKFGYFINFLNRNFDVHWAKLINSDLNYKESFKKLKLSFYLLNTSAPVNPLRSNKAGLDWDNIKIFIGGSSDEKKIISMHHSPTYEINYFKDILEEKGASEKFIKAFIEIIYNKDVKDNFDFCDLEIKSIYDNEFQKDYFSLRDIKNKNYVEELRAAYKELIEKSGLMSKEDQIKFRNDADKLFSDLKPSAICSGHIHNFKKKI